MAPKITPKLYRFRLERGAALLQDLQVVHGIAGLWGVHRELAVHYRCIYGKFDEIFNHTIYKLKECRTKTDTSVCFLLFSSTLVDVLVKLTRVKTCLIFLMHVDKHIPWTLSLLCPSVHNMKAENKWWLCKEKCALDFFVASFGSIWYHMFIRIRESHI